MNSSTPDQSSPVRFPQALFILYRIDFQPDRKSIRYSVNMALAYSSFGSECWLKDVRGWQFLTMKAAETLCIVCLPTKVSMQVVRIASTWLQTRFLRFPGIPWYSHGCNDGGYLYFSFTRNMCNRCIDSLKIFFGATSEPCSVIVTTIWRLGFTDPSGHIVPIREVIVLRHKYSS